MTDALAASPLGHAIGVALLQFVWQGTAIGVATALALVLLRRTNAQMRYIVSCVGLLAMTMAPVISASRSLQTPLRATGAPSASAPAISISWIDSPLGFSVKRLAASSGLSSPSWWSQAVERSLPAVVLAWIAGVLLLSLGLLITWALVERTRGRSTSPVADEWRDRAAALASSLRLTRAFRLVESSLVDVPTVIGWLQPVVLFPASAFAGLPPAQLEAVIAHELAHIRRQDYLVNLVQSLVETLLFFHPAVWWLSNRIRIEREHCCDDIAVALCGDRLVYADALTSLAELRTGTPALAMAASGGSLLGRIRRLLDVPRHHERQSPTWLIACLALATVFVTSIGGLAKSAPARPAAPILPRTASVAGPAKPTGVPRPIQSPVSARTPQSSRNPAPVATATTRQSQAPGTVLPEGSRILDLEERFRRAKVASDVGALASIFDDEYVGTNQNGNRYNKSQELELWKTFRISSLVVDPSKIGFSGDTAVVMGRMTEVNATGTDRMLFTRIWKHDSSGAWRLLSGTQFRDPHAEEVPDSRPQDSTTGTISFGWPQANAAEAGVGEDWTTYAADATPGTSTTPRLTTHVSPIYPQVALAAGIEGSPTMEFTINLKGDVVDPRIVRHVPLLDQASLDAVRQWKFIPASVDGRLHPIRVTLTFNFKLRK